MRRSSSLLRSITWRRSSLMSCQRRSSSEGPCRNHPSSNGLEQPSLQQVLQKRRRTVGNGCSEVVAQRFHVLGFQVAREVSQPVRFMLGRPHQDGNALLTCFQKRHQGFHLNGHLPLENAGQGSMTHRFARVLQSLLQGFLGDGWMAHSDDSNRIVFMVNQAFSDRCFRRTEQGSSGFALNDAVLVRQGRECERNPLLAQRCEQVGPALRTSKLRWVSSTSMA